MKNLFSPWLILSLAAAAQASTTVPIVLKNRSLEVSLDPAFPRVICYHTPQETIAGQSSPTSQVRLNGQPANCQVTLKRKSNDTAIYQLTFADQKISIDLTVSVSLTAVDMKVTRLNETGSERIKTLAFPDNALLTVSTAAPNAALAACLATNINDQFGATFRERITPIADLKPSDKDTGNYLFLSENKLAAGIGCGNFTDTNRTSWSISESANVKTCTAQNPVWEFRMFDDEKPELPWVKVIITPDINDDGKTDWQDAAIAFRREMPKPLGHELVKSTVGENIAMNFASGAQQPFLKILDEIKRFYLATDGLGNQVIIKGFSSEGHDSANTDYAGNWNERAGGLADLKYLLDRAATYHSRIGIHINATEAYPEAIRYKPEILRKDSNGNLKGGWSWLDTAHMIDKIKDVRSGQLFAALDQMRHDLPKLDFVYVDTYWDNGWAAAKTAKKINSLGLPMYSEGDSCLDPWISWSHWRGTKHTIQRFLWFSDRDQFANDSILRAGRSDEDGFMGWQNHHNFHTSIRSTFVRNLPSKFLKHFELLRWKPGESAGFSNNVNVIKSNNKVTLSQDGRELMTWTGDGADSKLFVPWPPNQPVKCYAWTDDDGSLDRSLPPSWKSQKEVFIYQLTDCGRTAETPLPVTDGKISAKIIKGTPYVIYPSKATPQKPMSWGDGSPINDPGFDSRSFSAWKLSGTANVESDSNGNPRLIMPNGKASVTQPLSNLKPGKTYAATVWAQTTGERTATIEVTNNGKSITNFVSLCNVRHSAPNDSRTGTKYQRLRVVFCATTHNIITLKGSSGSGSVEFDELRVVPTKISPEASKHFFWEDFENVETGGYGPFTCCPGERTHLSENNPPYTTDTIHGRYSLKSRDKGCVARTVPSSLRLKPTTKYRITCQTIGNGRITTTSKGKITTEIRFPNKPNNGASAITGDFITLDDTESYLSLFRDGGDFITIDDLAIDELGPATTAEITAAHNTGSNKDNDLIPGMKVIYEEKFESPLRKEWSLKPSKLPGTSIEVKNGTLSINGYANISICADLTPLPTNLSAAEIHVDLDGEVGETWGPGMTLIWPGGQQLRINMRSPNASFGIDSTAAAQSKVGKLSGGSAKLRIRLDDQSVIAEARCNGDNNWQSLVTFPRNKFPGTPSILRLGKTHAVEGLDDHTATGAIGTTTFSQLRLFSR